MWPTMPYEPTGVSLSQENATPQDPAVSTCVGPYGGPRGAEVIHARGTPVRYRAYRSLGPPYEHCNASSRRLLERLEGRTTQHPGFGISSFMNVVRKKQCAQRLAHTLLTPRRP